MITEKAKAQRPIRVAIDARPFSGSPCGYTIYLASILHCLQGSAFELTLLSNKPLQPSYGETAGLAVHVFGAVGDLRWEQGDLPAFLATHHHDVYFSGANRGMPWKKRADTRYILGLLDVIPYLFFREYFLKRLRAWITNRHLHRETAAQLLAVARADAILTISHQSAMDIHRIFRRRDVTAYPIRLADIEPAAAEPPQPQFAYVGGIDVRKKVDVLLRGFAKFRLDHPDHRLVLVGSDHAALMPLVTQLGLEHHVDLTGYVSHKTKFRILRQSLAMIYPSLYEGYGLAIAEGFQAGIPVAAGGGGSQDEIGGAATRRIDPTSPDDIAAAMAEMLDPKARNRWIACGREQLKRLSDPSIEHCTANYFLKQGRIARRCL